MDEQDHGPWNDQRPATPTPVPGAWRWLRYPASLGFAVASLITLHVEGRLVFPFFLVGFAVAWFVRRKAGGWLAYLKRHYQESLLASAALLVTLFHTQIAVEVFPGADGQWRIAARRLPGIFGTREALPVVDGRPRWVASEFSGCLAKDGKLGQGHCPEGRFWVRRGSPFALTQVTKPYDHFQAQREDLRAIGLLKASAPPSDQWTVRGKVTQEGTTREIAVDIPPETLDNRFSLVPVEALIQAARPEIQADLAAKRVTPGMTLPEATLAAGEFLRLKRDPTPAPKPLDVYYQLEGMGLLMDKVSQTVVKAYPAEEHAHSQALQSDYSLDYLRDQVVFYYRIDSRQYTTRELEAEALAFLRPFAARYRGGMARLAVYFRFAGLSAPVEALRQPGATTRILSWDIDDREAKKDAF